MIPGGIFADAQATVCGKLPNRYRGNVEKRIDTT